MPIPRRIKLTKHDSNAIIQFLTLNFLKGRIAMPLYYCWPPNGCRMSTHDLDEGLQQLCHTIIISTVRVRLTRILCYFGDPIISRSSFHIPISSCWVMNQPNPCGTLRVLPLTVWHYFPVNRRLLTEHIYPKVKCCRLSQSFLWFFKVFTFF